MTETRKPKRRQGFQAAGYLARPAVQKAAAGKGFAEPDVLVRWDEIAGAALSRLCRPVKVSYGGSGLGATLIVETSSARAPEVDHLRPRMIERINQFYGYSAISRIRITQSHCAPAGFAETQAAFDGPPVDPRHQRRAVDMARDIRDPDLRAALVRMGASVLAGPTPKDEHQT